MFDFHIIPTAEASVVTLMKSINRVIINPIIYFLFACALVYFLYGVSQYLLSPDNEEVRKKSKSVMLWGIIGLFIMVAVFGIMRIILNTIGADNIKIRDNGNYEVAYQGDKAAVESKDAKVQLIGQGNVNTEKKIDTSTIDLGTADQNFSPNNQTFSTTTNYALSPFPRVIENFDLCWHNDVAAQASTEYKALNAIPAIARARMLKETHLTDSQIDKKYPVPYSTKTLYDSVNKKYYVWWDARAPLKSNNMEDCTLLPAPMNQSTKTSSLMGKYLSDATAYRTVESGVAKTLVEARAIAYNNALIKIALQKKVNSLSLVGDVNLLEETYFPPDSTSDKYHYFIAIEVLR